MQLRSGIDRATIENDLFDILDKVNVNGDAGLSFLLKTIKSIFKAEQLFDITYSIKKLIIKTIKSLEISDLITTLHSLDNRYQHHNIEKQIDTNEIIDDIQLIPNYPMQYKDVLVKKINLNSNSNSDSNSNSKSKPNSKEDTFFIDYLNNRRESITGISDTSCTSESNCEEINELDGIPVMIPNTIQKEVLTFSNDHLVTYPLLVEIINGVGRTIGYKKDHKIILFDEYVPLFSDRYVNRKIANNNKMNTKELDNDNVKDLTDRSITTLIKSVETINLGDNIDDQDVDQKAFGLFYVAHFANMIESRKSLSLEQIDSMIRLYWEMSDQQRWRDIIIR